MRFDHSRDCAHLAWRLIYFQRYEEFTIRITSDGVIDILRLQKIREALTLRPFDVSNPDGRSRERYRKVLLTAITGPITSSCSFLTFLITVPLTVRYLGPERYGAWMSLSALMAFLRFSDLGLGNGLVGAISQAEGRGDRLYAQRAISSVMVCLCISGAFLLVAFPVSTLFIHWDYVLGLASLKDRGEIQAAILIFVAAYAIGIPVNMVQQVQRSIQQGYISNLWMTAGSLISLVGVYFAATHHARIPWLVVIISGVPLMPALANGFVLYFVQRPDLRPSLKNFDRDVAKGLLHKGVLFLGLGIAAALAFDSQNIVIAHILGPAAVGVYAVVQRLYSTIPILVGYITMPLWPAFGEALGRQEWPWIARALRRGITANAVIASAFAIVLFLFNGPILLHWTHGAISAPKWLIAGFSVWAVTSAISSPICMLLNAAHVLWFQLVTSVIFGLMTITTTILFLPSMGLAAAVWSMVCVYLCTQLGPYLFYLRVVFFKSIRSQSESRPYQ
ncbi:MAG: lipopolysaccharide biosynthesis protein [Terracidiphilus sp.]|jgi:O-antigen/teichoic acid export membrane protein